jgi:Tol biopolymer transport system component
LWPTSSAPASLQQLTFEAGIAETPAVSPDGKLIPYASDRGGSGQSDIWLKQTAGGEPVRLTTGLLAKTNPQFSADGTRVYYLSGGSIFEIPTLGGATRKLVEHAGPFSLSSRGEIGFVTFGTGSTPGPITIIPAEGNQKEEWQTDCRSWSPPAWSPDGNQIVFAGYCGAFSIFATPASLFVAARSSGARRKIAVWDIPSVSPRIAWLRLRNRDGVALPMKAGDSINLHWIGFDGTTVPLTQGTGFETSPVVSDDGKLIFSRAEQTPRILSLGLDQVDEQPAVEAAPGDLFGTSRDGKILVYKRMVGLNKGDLVLRDRIGRTETPIAVHEVLMGGVGSLWPQVSPDGSQVVYRAITDTPGHYRVATSGGTPKFVIAATKFGLASDWSGDGRRVIGECAPAADGICEVDLDVGQARVILKDQQGGQLLYPSYSWDGSWVTFMLRRAGQTLISITPVRNGSLLGESDWVRVSSPTANASRPRFSPDGAAIYYELVEESTRVLVKQKVDPATKQPRGNPVRLATVRQSADLSIICTVTVTNDRVFFNTADTRSNVWARKIEN